MNLPYDDIPPQVRSERRKRQRLRAEWATHQAEYQGSDTPKDIVLQLRPRARRSTTAARIILGFLVLTIVAGLFYYLALPYIRQYLDGRRITLVEREAALEQALANLDEKRERLRDRLTDALANTGLSLTGDWSASAYFTGATALGDNALLVYGTEGTLVQIPNPLQNDVQDIALTDDAFRAFFDTDLPTGVRQLPEIDAIRTELLDIIGQRSPNLLELDKVKQDIADLWTGLLPLAQQSETFADFMRVCRGTPDPEAPDNGAITTACTNAWSQELQRETGNWWRTLADQVPQGILLLFLLATQGSLYRYNLRMAGFHASRADFLELLLMSSDSPDRIAKEDLERLVNLATAMGADKVEFGKGNLPTDQAVEMAKAIAGRG